MEKNIIKKINVLEGNFEVHVIPSGKEEQAFFSFKAPRAEDFPDIDYDVSDPDGLKRQLAEEWGQFSAVPVTNINTLKLKSLIKDVSRFYGLPFFEVNDITNKILEESVPLAKKKNEIEAGIYEPTFEEAYEFSKTFREFLEKYPEVGEHLKVLHKMPKSASRHAGGLAVSENLERNMPLISSGGTIQTPWCEGMNVRHLEPMGFIKFDILGLATLRMFETAIRQILIRHRGVADPTFEQIRSFYDETLHPDVLDFENQEIWDNIFGDSNKMNMGVFQFTGKGAQDLCKRVSPRNLDELSAVTAIFRPGPLSIGVDELFVDSKNNQDEIKYEHELLQEVLEKNYGTIIYQEDIAAIAHKLGKNISLEEGNKLRKVLIKKGIGNNDAIKEKIKKKFIAGCHEKGISSGEEIWEKLVKFNSYSFNFSHSVSYCIISFQCAYLQHYFPLEWTCAFLDKETEDPKKKEKAISIVKSNNIAIENVNVNLSEVNWSIKEGRLVAPLSSIKGLGDVAIEQITKNRPFQSVEELIFNDNISYSKLNKRGLDALVRSNAIASIVDSRFKNLKHLWASIVVNRPKTIADLFLNLEAFKDEEEFSEEEKISFETEITGVFPLERVISQELRSSLRARGIPPLSEYDEELGLCWGIPREIEIKTTKNGKEYWVVSFVDENFEMQRIKFWGIRKSQSISLNRVYVLKPKHEVKWGFSVNNIDKQLRRIT